MACSSHGGRPQKSVEERFWANVIKSDIGCWEWVAAHSKFGYGQLSINGKTVDTHRLSWRIHYGEPGKMDVCHKCDNPRCIRPDHLFLGSASDNAIDMVKKKPWSE